MDTPPCLHLHAPALFHSCLLSSFSLFIFRCFLSPLSIFPLSPSAFLPSRVGGRARFASMASSARGITQRMVWAWHRRPSHLSSRQAPPPLPPPFRFACPCVFFFVFLFCFSFAVTLFFFFSTSSFLNSRARGKVIQCRSVNNVVLMVLRIPFLRL